MTRPSGAPERRPWQGGAALLLAALAMCLCQLLVCVRSAPPAARPVTAPAHAFSADRALAELEPLLGDGRPHPIGSEAGRRVRERIVDRLRALGLRPRLQAGVEVGAGTWARVTNVIAELPGQAPEAGAVLLSVHYDSVAAGPGAADDGAGVAAALEIARALTVSPRLGRNVVLLFNDGEEAGLYGASVFMNGAPEAQPVVAVVNLEARGSHGQSLMFEAVNFDAATLAAMARALPRPATSSLYSAIYERLPNDTDLTVYRYFGLCGYNFGFIRGVAHYHTPLDDLAHLDRRSVQHHGDNALALLRALGDPIVPLARATPRARPPTLVWFDVLGLAVWCGRVPTVAVALTLAVGMLVAVAMVRRRAAPRLWRNVLTSAFASLNAVALALGPGFAVMAVWRARSGALLPWYAYPAPGTIALWCGALGVITLAGVLLGPRWAFWERFLGVWLAWAALAAAVTLLLPQASYLFVLPVLCAGVVAAMAAWRDRGRSDARAAWLLGLAPMVAAAIVWLPVAQGIVDAVGLDGHPAVAGSVALVATGLWPLLGEIRGTRARWLAPVAAASGLCAATFACLAVPSFSRESPQRVSLAHVQREGEATARWLADVSWGAVPEPLQRVGGFGPPEPPPVRWLGVSQVASGPAPRLALPAPSLQVRGRAVRPNGELRVTATLRSARGARMAALLFPPETRVRALRIEGTPVSLRLLDGGSWWSGWRMAMVLTLPAEGVSTELELEGDGGRAVEILDVVDGLPAEGAPLAAARGELAVPSQDGDLSVVVAKAAL